MVAPAGAGPCPQITSGLPLRVSNRITGTSPPGPLRCGSTTCSVKAVAQAASKALPPRSRMPMPTAVAIQWVEVTTPKGPVISGRVGKGVGLMSFKALPPGGANWRARVGTQAKSVHTRPPRVDGVNADGIGIGGLRVHFL